jgi:hypothetical protein
MVRQMRRGSVLAGDDRDLPNLRSELREKPHPTLPVEAALDGCERSLLMGPRGIRLTKKCPITKAFDPAK